MNRFSYSVRVNHQRPSRIAWKAVSSSDPVKVNESGPRI